MPSRCLIDGGIEFLLGESLATDEIRSLRAGNCRIRLLTEVLVHFGGRRTGCAHGRAVRRRHSFPSVLGYAPVDQRTPRAWCSLRTLDGACGNALVHIDLAAVFVIGGDHSSSVAAGTRFCLHVWRGERKEGRDYGTSHQGELQAFSHNRVRAPPLGTKDPAAAYPEPDGET